MVASVNYTMYRVEGCWENLVDFIEWQMVRLQPSLNNEKHDDLLCNTDIIVKLGLTTSEYEYVL